MDMTKLLSVLLPGLLCATSFEAVAQAYPNRPIRLVVGYAPGGGTDSLARVFADKISQGLGQPVIVDNRPGAAGNIASDYVVRAAPDGYTILMGNVGPMAVNPYLYKLSFDPMRDLAPVTLLATAPLLVVVNPKLPVQTLQDLVALARRQPGRLSYSSAGVGSSNHLAGALFNIEAGTRRDGLDLRPGATVFPDPAVGREQREGQHAEGAGGDQRDAIFRVSRSPDRRRGRPEQFRGQRLV